MPTTLYDGELTLSCSKGFVFGDISFEDYQLRKISVEQEVVTVNAEYR